MGEGRGYIDPATVREIKYVPSYPRARCAAEASGPQRAGYELSSMMILQLVNCFVCMPLLSFFKFPSRNCCHLRPKN